MFVTYEGVDLPGIKEKNNDREILTKYNLEPRKYFLYIGNAYPHKNLKRAIEAVVQSRSTLAISGARDVFLERLQKLVGDLHAKDNVKLLGFVPDEEIAVLYKNSIAFVYPSIMEGFGLQGLEAMTSETLLLASEIPVFKEIYKDNAIYFNPFDFSDIARKMEIAKEMSEPRRKEIIAKAKKFVSNYSWKKMAQETLEVYNSVLS